MCAKNIEISQCLTR